MRVPALPTTQPLLFCTRVLLSIPLCSYEMDRDARQSYWPVFNDLLSIKATFHCSSSWHVIQALEGFLRIRGQKQSSLWGLVRRLITLLSILHLKPGLRSQVIDSLDTSLSRSLVSVDAPEQGHSEPPGTLPGYDAIVTNITSGAHWSHSLSLLLLPTLWVRA